MPNVLIETDETVSKISIMGAGMIGIPGIVAKVFEALLNKNVTVKMISTSEIKISVIVYEKYSQIAFSAINDIFGQNTITKDEINYE